MSKIPELLWEHINTGWHDFTGIVSVILPDGYTQVSPRGSLVVLDGETFAYWDLGSGRTHETVTDGTKITVYFQKGPLHGEGLLVGGVARFYGTTSLHFDDEIRIVAAAHWSSQTPHTPNRDTISDYLPT